MPYDYKAMILVTFVTTIMFALAKPLFGQFMSPQDYGRRRNIWIALTVAAFGVPNFWLYMAFAAAVLAYGGRKDSNPAALYLFLLLTVPPISKVLPVYGVINNVLTLNHFRLLSLVVLLPALLTAKTSADSGAYQEQKRSFALPDTLIWSFIILQLALAFPYSSITSQLRQLMETCLDTVVPYYVLSRTVRSKQALTDAMAAFVLAIVVLAPLAVGEMVKGWPLFGGIETSWEGSRMFAFLKRGDFLRAQVSTGHSLVFGFAVATAIGMWLSLRSQVESKLLRNLATLTLAAALIASLARGAWVGTAAVLLLFLVFGRGAKTRMLKTLAGIGGVAAAVAISPWGSQVADYLPLIGSIDEGSVVYRQRLAEMSWLLIQQNPLFGTPFYLAYMEELRTGEGIIDIVNTYAGIALSSGIVGLSLWVLFFLVAAYRCFQGVRSTAQVDPDLSLLGAGLIACLGGSLVMIATVSDYLSIPMMMFSVASLALAFERIAGEVCGADAITRDLHRFDASIEGVRAGY